MNPESVARRMFRWSLAVAGLLGVLGLLGLLGPLGTGGTNSPAEAQVTSTPENVESGSPTTTTGATTGTSGSAATPATPATPAIVKVGFLVNDIQDINLEQHRYQIDFYIWYQWTDPDLDPPASMEFMNDGERWATMRSPAFNEPVRLDDGSFYYRERVLSMFRSNLPLEDYPYDTPNLRIVIEDVALGTDALVFVLDDPAVEASADLSVPGYTVGVPTATVTDWVYSPMGAIDSGSTTSSRIVLTIPMSRPWLPYTAKIFVPFLIIILCASIVLLIHPKHVDARFGMGISALLTLVALKWITDGEIPNVDYLGLVDSLYLMAFLFIAVGLIETTYSTWREEQGDDAAHLARIGLVTLVVAGALCFVGCVGILLAFLL
jgi:hypothetical protein